MWACCPVESVAAAAEQDSQNIRGFYRATRMHSADYAVARCLSVCLSVRQSHAGRPILCSGLVAEYRTVKYPLSYRICSIFSFVFCSVHSTFIIRLHIHTSNVTVHGYCGTVRGNHNARHFRWLWVTSEGHLKVITVVTLCAQLTRDLLAIAKFLVKTALFLLTVTY